MYSILIVDDHPLIADGLRNLLAEYKLCNNASWASSGKDCLSKLQSESFDLILLDISLPDINGIDLCMKIKTDFPDCRILALTSFGEFNWVHSMMSNGASGYLLKNAMPEEIIRGVETVMQGEKFLCHEVDILMKKEEDKHIFLTRRETEMLKLIAEGYTNPEIADKLFLGALTVKSYRKNLLFKLNAKNTAALVKMAIEQKLF